VVANQNFKNTEADLGVSLEVLGVVEETDPDDPSPYQTMVDRMNEY
jgi:hypothetical protein